MKCIPMQLLACDHGPILSFTKFGHPKLTWEHRGQHPSTQSPSWHKTVDSLRGGPDTPVIVPQQYSQIRSPSMNEVHPMQLFASPTTASPMYGLGQFGGYKISMYSAIEWSICLHIWFKKAAWHPRAIQLHNTQQLIVSLSKLLSIKTKQI
jgi:hypothetical protein